ncbi:hypothetical protein LshimejAT787_1003810 [Lyophyllum shimeji]|uniref:Uncharacterized protein n=1 Tax=Lyophyllum shimeji TaxID=47721 RepID=A0A9P3PU81_LYOSH|nr:hypothetical protein LshimejAT787_1003810 [Lyophyllum shimeji]
MRLLQSRVHLPVMEVGPISAVDWFQVNGAPPAKYSTKDGQVLRPIAFNITPGARVPFAILEDATVLCHFVGMPPRVERSRRSELFTASPAPGPWPKRRAGLDMRTVRSDRGKILMRQVVD